MRTVRISVCIATYNGEKFIKRQLESIISQLDEHDEIIVSDDGSTDATLQIVKSVNSPLVRVVNNKSVHGYTGNFENALNEAKGEYIFLSDQDDEWAPNKVEKCMQYLDSCDFVVSDASIVDAQGGVLAPSFFLMRSPKTGFWGNLYKFGYIGCCMAFRRNVLVKALPIPRNHVLCSHDNWLMLVASLYHRCKVVNDKLVSYRRHGGNASTGEVKGRKSSFFRIKYRAYLFGNVLSRCWVKQKDA